MDSEDCSCVNQVGGYGKLLFKNVKIYAVVAQLVEQFLGGSQDLCPLIGKPFSVFRITVKGLAQGSDRGVNSKSSEYARTTDKES